MGCVFSSVHKVKQEARPSSTLVSTNVSKPSDSANSLYVTRDFANEAARLLSLQGCNVLDTEPEPRFEAIVNFAADLFDAPCALVSLIDDYRLWFKAEKGGFPPCVNREGSFCSYVVVPDHAEVLIVEDATKDARFSTNPYVTGPPGLRFYAGCPLVSTDGFRYGTLCVVDFRPRYVASTTYNVLCNLAELTLREIEREMSVERGEPLLCNNFSVTGQKAIMAMEGPPLVPTALEPVALIDIGNETTEWRVVYANPAWNSLCHREESQVLKESFWTMFEKPENIRLLQTALSTGQSTSIKFKIRPINGEKVGEVTLKFQLAGRDQLPNAVPVGVPSFVPYSDEKGGEHEQNCDDRGNSVMERKENSRIRASALYLCIAEGCTQNSMQTSKETRINSRWNSFEDDSVSLFAPRIAKVSQHKPPHRLAHLELGPLLGQGSFGKVYRGQLAGKVVAVKVLDLADSEDIYLKGDSRHNDGEGSISLHAKKVLAEAAMSRHLVHPKIVPTLEYFLYDNTAASSAYPTTQVWIVQHLCDKGTLYAAIEKGWYREFPAISAPPSLPTIVDTALDIASAMQYVHERDIVHGDLNGNNVLLTSHETVSSGFIALVADFGLSRSLGLTRNVTRTIGTITHMPPELLKDGLLTKAADVYAFGVLLWELYNGKRAWAGANVGQVIFAVTCRGEALVMPSSAPQDLQILVGSCLSSNYEDRPSFGQIVAELTRMKACAARAKMAT